MRFVYFEFWDSRSILGHLWQVLEMSQNWSKKVGVSDNAAIGHKPDLILPVIVACIPAEGKGPVGLFLNLYDEEHDLIY